MCAWQDFTPPGRSGESARVFPSRVPWILNSPVPAFHRHVSRYDIGSRRVMTARCFGGEAAIEERIPARSFRRRKSILCVALPYPAPPAGSLIQAGVLATPAISAGRTITTNRRTPRERDEASGNPPGRERTAMENLRRHERRAGTQLGRARGTRLDRQEYASDPSPTWELSFSGRSAHQPTYGPRTIAASQLLRQLHPLPELLSHKGIYRTGGVGLKSLRLLLDS